MNGKRLLDRYLPTCSGSWCTSEVIALRGWITKKKPSFAREKNVLNKK